jgi:hypothetical protein
MHRRWCSGLIAVLGGGGENKYILDWISDKHT